MSRDEGGVVVLPDGTVKIVVQPLAPPKDVDIELMKVNLQATRSASGREGARGRCDRVEHIPAGRRHA